MSITKQTQRFFYSASALALSASITRPHRHHLTNQTAAVLSPTGGFSQQSTEETNFQNLIYTGRATATVIGEESDEYWTTLATVVIEDLDILGVVRADAIVSRISARYPKKGPNDAMHPSTFFFDSSAYHGLRINGQRQTPTLALVSIPAQKSKAAGLVAFDKKTGGLRFSKSAQQVIQIFGNIPAKFEIPEFGTIYPGELDVFGGRATLSMLRISLGCAAAGSSSVCVPCTNGHKIPGG